MSKVLVRKWSLVASLLLTSAFLTVGCATPREASQSVIEVPQTVEERLEGAARTAYEGGAYAGLSVGVYRNGDALFEGQFGEANIENAVPVDSRTVFYVGSITKPFTGLAANLLIEEGALSLSDTVGQILPGYQGAGSTVTVAQLLSQTSGIPDYVDAAVSASFIPYSREDVLALFSGKPLVFTPGERWQYSNSNAYLLGLIIEAVTGKTYGEFISERVAAPLGLASTQFADETLIVPHRADGYFLSPNGYLNAPKYDPLLPFSAGSLLSTPGDIAKFARAAYGSGQSELVSNNVRERLLSPVVLPGGLESFYRLGSVALLSFEGRRKVSHAGLTAGFTSHFGYYPDDDLVVVVLANGSGVSPHPAHIEAELARIALGLPQPSISAEPIDEVLAGDFSGDYKLAPAMFFGTDVFGFVVRDGGLAFQFGPSSASDPAIPLVYIGEDVFVSAADSEHVFSFRRNEAGDVVSLDLEFYGMPFSGAHQP
ncbi:MAG: beta-lactamase family protein [Hyphomonas sp.]|uniref:serine hydrolase domain-containing protein n=1 Tax=Hyphomonas sp. TaxID=87 RepID=UPI0017E1F252|nr:serine hydrolase domain-containing protein [Hyphomonas sp.]MBA3069253.1 beta-lactamase family protein [Hyphomonas sp.]MBU3922499.1 beta-lactamase family protein [Alphaproteobacteria bacterium]MBU4061800.1 beta-lactamase family protein [Alphaproteobacteria bacterium]MBU4163368.1 beta-lactamase family protein [Alphaproteobacteria bacterium]